MHLVLKELTLILEFAFNFKFAHSMLLALLEFAIIHWSILRCVCTLFKVIPEELPYELIPIRVYKLTMNSVLFTFWNVAVVPASIGILYFSMDEISIIKLAFINPSTILPDSSTFRFIIFYVSFISIAVLVMKLSFDWSPVFKSAFKVSIFAIFHLSLPMRFAVLVALSNIERVVGARNSIRLVPH